MHNSDQDQKLEEILARLRQKYEADGQELNTHLEGLLNSQYIRYWDYIHLDTLLSLQKPKTDFPDEMIFITYHQITELYFKMVLHEMCLVREHEAELNRDYFLKRMKRINWYFSQLIESFDVIAIGMEQEEFMKFRTALHPASGFQSVQYRMVEIVATDFINLVGKEQRNEFTDYATIDEMFEAIYWKKGAIDLKTGKKSLTLRLFEEKYGNTLLQMANDYQSRNLWAVFKRLSYEIQQDPEIVKAMKVFDTFVNINWPLAHYKYAVSYLFRDKERTDSTGGTNWQKYLPPRFQKRVFFPTLYTEEEMRDWGKSWVETEVLGKLGIR